MTNQKTYAQIPDLVEILIKDPILPKKWSQFSTSLVSLSVDKITWKEGINIGRLSYYDLFTEILQNWIARYPNKTVHDLCEVLTKMENVALKETISAKYTKELKIVNNENEVNQFKQECSDLNIRTNPYELNKGLKILDISKKDKKLVIYTEIIIHLLKQAWDIKVVIISINGRQRSGKSFMLNQFKKYLQFGYTNSEVDWLSSKLENPFEWGGGMKRITSGIEVLSQPSLINVNGEDIAVYLMDTQGLFDNQTDIKDNILIFAFSLLLSSVTIFNDKVHSEDVLQFLQLFLEYAKITAAEDGGNNQHFSFQQLIFLLRDWEHEEEFKWGHYDDNECPPGQIKNVKQRFLDTWDSNLSKEAVKTRNDITSSFQKITFFASPHPNCRNSILNTDNPSQWNENFRNYVTEFVKRTLSQENISKSVKSIGNVKQTGRTLSAYVETWAKIILTPDGLPEFSTLLEATIKLHYQNLLSNLIQKYKNDLVKFILQNTLGVSADRFLSEHEKTVQKCIAQFNECSCVGGDEAKMRYKTELQSALEMEKETFGEANDSNVSKELKRQSQIREQQNRYGMASEILDRAKAKLQLVQDNRNGYTREETYTARIPYRIFGREAGHVNHDAKRLVFDQGKFDAARKEAEDEVNFWTETVQKLWLN